MTGRHRGDPADRVPPPDRRSPEERRRDLLAARLVWVGVAVAVVGAIGLHRENLVVFLVCQGVFVALVLFSHLLRAGPGAVR